MSQCFRGILRPLDVDHVVRHQHSLHAPAARIRLHAAAQALIAAWVAGLDIFPWND